VASLIDRTKPEESSVRHEVFVHGKIEKKFGLKKKKKKKKKYMCPRKYTQCGPNVLGLLF